jgi:hypothetical protein
VNVLVQPPNDSLEAMATLFFSSRSVKQLGAAAVQLHVADIYAEEIDASVAGDGLGQDLLVRRLD